MSRKNYDAIDWLNIHLRTCKIHFFLVYKTHTFKYLVQGYLGTFKGGNPKVIEE